MLITVDVSVFSREHASVMRWCIIAVAGVVALATLTASASSAVTRVSITSPVEAGEVVTLTVHVAPEARCTIAVADGSYVSAQSTLGPRTGGRIKWRWKLRSTARPGRSPVIVRCATSGTLRTTFAITAADLPLAAAAQAACARIQDRVLDRYKTELVKLLDRTLAALHEQYGAFDCAYGSNYYKDGGPISYYIASATRGKRPCTYSVKARVIWVSDPPLPGYDGPKDETYTETCTTLRG